MNCGVLALEKPKRVAYSGKGGDIDTVVSFELAPSGKGTRLVMEQTGFAGLKGLVVSSILKPGWKRMIEARLPAAVARVQNGTYTG